MPSGRQNHSWMTLPPECVPRKLMELSAVAVTTNRPVASVPAVGCTHGALVGFGGGRTRTVTVSAALSFAPSLTTSVNTRSVRTDGAVNVGDAEFQDEPGASVSAELPPVCVQR